MILPGLVSITFRALTPIAIVDLVRQAGLAGIEWGVDVHVPHGDTARAKEVRRLTCEAGLAVAAYGSYYRLSVSESEGLPWLAVLDTAETFGAPVIRVWAGQMASSAADEAARGRVAEDALRCAAAAADRNLRVAYEWHAGTLTDTAASARALLAATPHPALRCCWQPPLGWSEADRLSSLREMLPRLENLHVFHWSDDGKRLPLAEGHAVWIPRLTLAAAAPGDRYALIEYVANDSPEQFLDDARELLTWCVATGDQQPMERPAR